MNRSAVPPKVILLLGLAAACRVAPLDYRSKSCAQSACPRGLVCVSPELVCEPASDATSGGRGGLGSAGEGGVLEPPGGPSAGGEASDARGGGGAVTSGRSGMGAAGGTHTPPPSAGGKAANEAAEGGAPDSAGSGQSGGEGGMSGDGGHDGLGGVDGEGVGGHDGSATGGMGGLTGGVGGLSGSAGGMSGSTGGGLPRGSLVSSDGRCVSAPLEVTSTSLVLGVCNPSPEERWLRDHAGRLYVAGIGAAGVAAMQVEGDGLGAPLIVADASDAPNQQWTFADVHLVNRSGLCIDMPWGDFNNLMRAQLASCHWDPPQAWTLSPAGEISHLDAGKSPPAQCLDVYGGFLGDGVQVQTYLCQESNNQEFSFDDGRLLFQDECIGVFGDDPSVEHSPLETQTCRATDDPERVKQQFYVEGPIQSLGGCLDWDDASAELRLLACDGSDRQHWRWYF